MLSVNVRQLHQMSSWFASVSQFVDDTFDNVLRQVNDAQSELEEERTKFAREVALPNVAASQEVSLPWETDREDLEILSNDAMEQMLKLSVTEENFTVPPLLLNEENSPNFDFNAFVPVALRLLELDPNLASMHAKLMPKMEEVQFWKHYHYRIYYLRSAIGLDGQAAKLGSFGSQRQDDVPIFAPEYHPPAQTNDINSALTDTDAKVFENTAPIVHAAPLTEAEQLEAAAKQRRQEEAALAAEVEAELLGEGFDLDDLDADIDAGDLADLDGSLADFDALEAELDKDDGLGKAVLDPKNCEDDDIDSNLGVLTLDELDEVEARVGHSSGAVDDLDAAIEAELAMSPPAFKERG